VDVRVPASGLSRGAPSERASEMVAQKRRAHHDVDSTQRIGSLHTPDIVGQGPLELAQGGTMKGRVGVVRRVDHVTVSERDAPLHGLRIENCRDGRFTPFDARA
jgi:hypothetical protein